MKSVENHCPGANASGQSRLMPALSANWYDYPSYGDLCFRDETKAEAAFIVAACRKYGRRPVRRLLELGCGGGRLVVALARQGFKMVALDNNAAALAYLRKRLERHRLRADLLQADMADFRLSHRVDAAFCTFNTFRHLTTEAAARRHLQCVANSLRPGGCHILGFHLLPLDVAEESCERWTARHGSIRLTAALRVTDTNRRRRLERLRIDLTVRTPRHVRRLRSEFDLRMYTAAQFRRLLASVPAFTLCDVYDFWYEIDRPRRLTEEMTDTVFILRKETG